MVDAIYVPEPIENKPNWFNGFINLGKHGKEKYNWYRYVYLPDYYRSGEYIDDPKHLDTQSRFGKISPKVKESKFIAEYFTSYYRNTSTSRFDVSNKEEIGGKAIGNVVILNAETGQEEQHRYFYANGEYIVRQLDNYDRQDVKIMTVVCSKELEEFLLYHKTFELLEKGLIVAPFNKDGGIKGIQTYTVTKDYAAPEPMGYLHPDCRGQGIFNIFHDYSIELGEAVGVEYLYAQTAVENEKTASIYESYGYIRNKEIKKAKHKSYYVLKYPLKTKQQSFF